MKTMGIGVMAVAALVGVAGCGGTAEERICTMIGGESGVGVQVVDPEAGVGYRLCVGTVCGATARRGGRGSGPDGVFVTVRLPDSVGETEVTVRFTATRDGSRRPVVDERATVGLRRMQPNGPHCPPTVYEGGLTYSRGAGLVAVVPTEPDRS